MKPIHNNGTNSERSKRVLIHSVLLFFCLALTIFILSTPAHAFKGDSTSCLKCHSFAEGDAKIILEKLNIGGAKVLGIQMSPIKGLWEVAVENRGQRFVIYVDFAKKLVSPGPFIDYAARIDITRDRIEDLNKDKKIDIGKVSLDSALLVGKADAPIKVVVFTDPG
jgi:thiol:disulfide interchange protein DsbC